MNLVNKEIFFLAPMHFFSYESSLNGGDAPRQKSKRAPYGRTRLF